MIVDPPRPTCDAPAVVENDTLVGTRVLERCGDLFDRPLALDDDEIGRAQANRVVEISGARGARPEGRPHVLLEGARIVVVDPLADAEPLLAPRIERQHVPGVVEHPRYLVDLNDSAPAKHRLAERGPFDLVAEIAIVGRITLTRSAE